MGQTSTGTVRMSAAVAILAVLGLLLSVFMLAAPAAAAGDKVTICHATGSDASPFVGIKVPPNSGYEPHLSGTGTPLSGHDDDFLLENTEDCDDVADTAVTPLAPVVGAATCAAAGTLTLTAVVGVSYAITPAYTAGASGAFTVTATADEDDGFVIAEGAQTVFNVTVQARLNCVAALAPSVSAGTCAAPGALTLNAVTGVTYVVSPAYAAGASGSFTVTASAAAGFTLTGPTVFVVNVPVRLVCEATLAGTPTPTPTPAAPAAPAATPVVRAGTLAAAVPNTAMDAPMNQLPVVFLALLTLGSLGYLGRRNLIGIRNRR